MKKINNIIPLLLVFLLYMLSLGSCKKEQTTQRILLPPPSKDTIPPVANAGDDKNIDLPDNIFLTLNSSRSSDAYTDQLQFSWNKISGPPVQQIENINTSSPVFMLSTEGNYTFELTVKSPHSKLEDKDTILVTATWNNACSKNRSILTPQLTLVSASPVQISGSSSQCSAGNKIFFAGGYIDELPNRNSSHIDIYDLSKNSWTRKEMGSPKAVISPVAAGNKVLFAGGESENYNPISDVDIYDLSNQSLTTLQLGQARSGIAAVALGNRVFFAGGSNGQLSSDRVDILDLSDNSWDIARLSEARGTISAVSDGQKIYFAGGQNNWNSNNTLDTYDNSLGQWTAEKMSVPAKGNAAFFANNQLFFYGGTYNGNGTDFTAGKSVDIFDLVTHQKTADCLISRFPQYQINQSSVALLNGSVYLLSVNNGIINVYNTVEKTWSWTYIGLDFSSIFSVENELYVAKFLADDRNGYIGKFQIYRLHF